eukprot:TRINITY_DN45711_c0_g1_i1.p1 TRINITY_DN45711_c0_g1~~TRINITY_DN45711_c0_g1_i1.p1  ORF type:complete len:599 (+),score=153.92 TRINITY_DN45711_c0_g1_i1:29-1825(+)
MSLDFDIAAVAALHAMADSLFSYASGSTSAAFLTGVSPAAQQAAAPSLSKPIAAATLQTVAAPSSKGSASASSSFSAVVAGTVFAVAVHRHLRQGPSRKKRWGVRGSQAKVACKSYVTGPGWTDEVARIFNPTYEGPEWQPELGYRGRSTIRVMLDGEELVHNYAKAYYEHFGRWTGPQSAGIEKAFEYGAWLGGVPDEKREGGEEGVNLDSPEVMVFVAMPADLIESSRSYDVCDGYPELFRDTQERCLELMLDNESRLQGKPVKIWINEWIRMLQDQNRLITWKRQRNARGKPLPSALERQKTWQAGQMVKFAGLKKPPPLLSQVVAASVALQVGDKVEALKGGLLVKGNWMPSEWKTARVLAVNYDGTYDLQFEMNFGPYRENRLKGLNGKAMLSLRVAEKYKDNWGADSMPASFRMLQEMNYQSAVSPDRIRMPGMLDRLSDTFNTEANQDWYLCSSKKFVNTVHLHQRRKDYPRLAEWKTKFQFAHRWVLDESGQGLKFEPVPNFVMAESLRANHGKTGEHFEKAVAIDQKIKEKLDIYKLEMNDLSREIESMKPTEPAQPTRAAGPMAGEPGKVRSPLVLVPGRGSRSRRGR